MTKDTGYMDIFEKIIGYIKHLSSKQFRYLLIGVIFAATAIIMLTLYGIHQTSKNLAQEIDLLYKKIPHVAQLKKRFSGVEQERLSILESLDDNFNLRGFLESFATKHGIILKTNFEETVLDLEDVQEFNESTVQVAIENITTKKLTLLLQDLQKTDAIYIKQMNIQKTSPSTITATILFAALRKKYSIEE